MLIPGAIREAAEQAAVDKHMEMCEKKWCNPEPEFTWELNAALEYIESQLEDFRDKSCDACAGRARWALRWKDQA